MLQRPAKALATLAVACVVLSGCSTDGDPGMLTVYGPYVGREADVFDEVLASFEEETGIPTRYVGSNSLQSDLLELISTASLPDVAILPQPSLLPRLAEVGAVFPFDPDERRQIADAIGAQWSEIVSLDGSISAVPYRFVVKSLVWFRSDVFEDRGYGVPATLAELDSLLDLIIEDGYTPWCAGMDDGLATGWWGTDWVEDLIVRRAGPEMYHSWARLDISFTDPVIVDAMREFQDLVASEGAVEGGRSAILNRSVEEAMDPMFEDQPACLMHKQASFQSVWLPDGASLGDDRLDIFPLPDISEGPPPMMVSGEIAVSTSENPDGKRILLYLLEEKAFEPWRDVGGSVTAITVDESGLEGGSLNMRLARILDDASEVVYDASDLMPRLVGTDAFFAGMIDLVAGLSAEEVAMDIQQVVDGTAEP